MKTQRYLTTQTDQKRGKTRVAKSRFAFALRLIGCEGSARPITERSKAEAKRSQLAFSVITPTDQVSIGVHLSLQVFPALFPWFSSSSVTW